MSRLIEQLLASGDFPGKSATDLTLSYGRLLEQDKRNDIFLENPDFAQEYETLKDEIARARRPGFIDEFKGAFGSAVDEMQASGYALGALAAHGARGLGIPGAEPVRNKMLELMKDQQDESAQFQPSVPSYDKITNPGDLARYVTYGLGTVAPSMAQAAISGLAGAAIGSAVGPEGTVGGALLGLAERRLAQKAVSALLEKGVKTVTLEQAAKAIPRELVAKEAKRLAVEYGGQAALAASSVGQEIGSIYADNPDAPGAAIGYGIPAGLLDVLPEAYIASKFLGAGKRVAEEEVKKSVGYFRRFATEAAKLVPMETGTESAQTLLEIAAAKSGRGESPTSFTDADYRQMVNAGIIGGIGALVMAPFAAMGNAHARPDPTGRIGETVVNRLPLGAPSEAAGPMAFGQGDNLLEGDLGLIEPPTPGPPLAPAAFNPMGGIGESETPDASFDPFQVTRPAYQSAQVFEQNERDPSAERGMLFEQAPGGAIGVTPQQPLGPPVPKFILRAQENAEEAARAWETAMDPPAPALGFGDTPVMPELESIIPPGETAAPRTFPQFGQLPPVPPSAEIVDAPLGNLVGTTVQYEGYTGILIRDREGNFLVQRTVGDTRPVEVSGTGKDPSVMGSAVGVVPTEPPNMTPKPAPGVAIPGSAPTNGTPSKAPLGDLFPNTLPPVTGLRGDVQGAPSGPLLAQQGFPQAQPQPVAPAPVAVAPAPTAAAPAAPVVPPVPVIAPTGVVTAPTGEQVIAVGDNGVKPLPADSAPNLKHLKVFEQPRVEPKINITEDDDPILPANARSKESVEASGTRTTIPLPSVALDNAVIGTAAESEKTSPYLAIIINNETGTAHARVAYRGAGKVLYIAGGSVMKGEEGKGGLRASKDADFVHGTAGRPLRGSQSANGKGILNETMPNGLPRYTVWGMGTLKKPGTVNSWNAPVSQLLNHAELRRAQERGSQEITKVINAAKDEMPQVTLRNEDFIKAMVAWRLDHNKKADVEKAMVRTREHVVYEIKAQGKGYASVGDAGLKAWTAHVIKTIETELGVARKQTSRISADYVAAPASVINLFKSTLRALTEGREVDVAAFEQGLMGAVDSAAKTTGLVITASGRRKIVAFAASAINGPINPATIISLLHETGHVITDGLSEPLRVAFQEAINQMAWQQQRWLLNPRSLDIRLIANAEPSQLSPEQRAALETLTAEEIAAARRIDPALLAEEQMAEHLAQLGWDKSEAKGVVQALVRFVKELWLKMAMAIQTALKGPDNLSPALARAYVENRYLQFIHRDSALASDRINDLMTWLGAPATESQKIPVFPAGPDWDQRMQFIDVATGEIIPVKTANYTPDSQAREIKLALDRAAQWVAQNPTATTPDTPALRFTQRGFFGAPFSSTPTITANKIFANVNLVAEVLRGVAAHESIAPLLPQIDGAPPTAEQFATEWLKLPPKQTPQALKQAALAGAQQPDPLTGQPIAHDPEMTVDALPTVEQKIVDREGKPKIVTITEAQDAAVKEAIAYLRDAFRRVTAQAGRDNDRVNELTREKERQGRGKGDFSSAQQYQLSRLSEEVLTRQKIALRLNSEINRLLEKFRPGDIVKVFGGAELLSVPSVDATEEQIRGARKYVVPKDMTFATAETRAALGAQISNGEAWLKNPDNRFQGQIYGIISEQVRKLRQIPLNQERAAVSAILRKLNGGFIGTLNASGLPSLRAMAKRFAGATAFEGQYRSELTTLGQRWSTAFGQFAESVGRPNDQAFVAEMWDPMMRVWNYIDSSKRSQLGMPGEEAIFAVMERALKDTAGIAIQGEQQRAALRALLMQSIERERFLRQMFEQHPELQVYDKDLMTYRRLFTHGLVTGNRGLARHMNALALQMNPEWSDTKGIAPGDVRSFWEAAGELYGSDRAAFDARIKTLFDGYVIEDFVAPFATNNVALFDVIGSDGEPRKASIFNARQAWSEAEGDVTRFAEILHQLEGAPEGAEGQTVGLILGNLRERFGVVKSIIDKMQAAANSGIETLQGQMLDGREADDLPAQMVSYGTMDVDSNLTLLHQLAMQSAFSPDALDPAKASFMGDKRSADGADPIAAGGEFAESVFAARRELTEIRQRFDNLHRDGLTEKQIEAEMGSDDYLIAKNTPETLAALKNAETDFRQLHSVTNYLNTELKVANNVVGLMASGMIQNPRSGLMQFNAILGMLVDLKFSSQAFKGLHGAIKNAAGELANSVLEAFGQQAAFAIPAAERRARIGARDSQTRTAWNEKIQGMGPRNQLGTPEGFESKGAKVGRTISRLSRRGRELLPNIGSPFAKPGDDNLAPKLTAGVFHTITQVAMHASMDAGYDLFADIGARGVEYLQNMPTADRAQFVSELELGVRDLGAEELGYFKGILLNDRAAFENLKAALETQFTGERSVGDFVAKAYRRMEAAAADADAGRGDGSWDIISDSQFVDISNYVTSQWTLEPNFTTLPPWMQGRLRPLFIFLTWPYLAMRQAAKGFTDSQQRMIWFGANSTVADGMKAFFILAAPATIAGSFAIDWYDKYLQGKKQNMRNAPPSTAIPVVGALLHPQAFLERWARYGTAGFASDILNMAVNYDSQRTLSLDSRVVAISAIQNLFNDVIKTPFAQEGNLTYGTFGRPLLQAVGAGGVLQYLQIAQNLLGLDTQDAAINARINTGNYLRAAGHELNLPVRVFAGPSFTPTPVTPYLQQMELAAFVNNPELFREAYRAAVQAERDEGHKDDAEKRVADNFVSRHPLRRLFKGVVTEGDYRKMLGEMDEYGATQVRAAVNSYNRFMGNWFGRKPYYGKADSGGESVDQLIRRATQINSGLEREDSLLALPR